MDHLIRGGQHEPRRLVSASRERPKSVHSDTANLIDKPPEAHESRLTGFNLEDLIRSNRLEENDDNNIGERILMPLKPIKTSRKSSNNNNNNNININKTSQEFYAAASKDKVLDSSESDIVMSSEKLTMLEEPAFSPGQTQNKLSAISRGALLNTLENNRSRRLQQDNTDNHIAWPTNVTTETKLEQNNNNSQLALQTIYQKTSDQQTLLNTSNVPNNRQLLILTFFGGFASLLLILLVALIFYNWFFAARRTRGRARRYKILRRFCSPLVALFVSRINERDDDSHQNERASTCEDSPGKLSSNLNEHFGCVSGERVQLVERRPLRSSGQLKSLEAQEIAGKRVLTATTSEQSDRCGEHETIEIVGEVSSLKQNRQEDGQQENRGEPGRENEKRSSTMVIVKRKLANNLFFLSSQPKVRLMGKRMRRKFIDDEAEEMRAKQVPNSDSSSWHSRITVYLASIFKSGSREEEEPNNLELNKRSEPTEDDSDLARQECCSDEPNNDKADEIVGEPDQSNSALIDKCQLAQESVQIDQKTLIGLSAAKCSQSPMALNDTCSSMSLFSPSPIVAADSSNNQLYQASQQASPWPSNPLDWQQLRLKAPREELSLVGGLENGCSTGGQAFLRSKSQNHTPLQSNCRNGSLVACRACCVSVSPSALNQRALEQACCQQQQLTNQITSNAAYRTDCANGQVLYENDLKQQVPTSAASSKFSSAGSKCLSSHLKRQYENYYDDEQEETYRRLTANIGMEFGIGFGHHHGHHHHGHHHHSVNTLNYCQAKSGATHLDEYAQFAPNCEAATCPQHRHRHGHLDEQHPMLIPPQQIDFSANIHTDIHQYPSPGACLCCHQQAQRAPSASFVSPLTIGQSCSAPSRPVLSFANKLAANCEQQQQAPVNTGYLLCQADAGGSAGELLTSSASTSLGGSDSGFAPTNPSAVNIMNSRQAICTNPLCACQVGQVGSLAMPMAPVSQLASQQPPMSIVVQQPSITSPPPAPLPPDSQQLLSAESSQRTTLDKAAPCDRPVGEESPSGSENAHSEPPAECSDPTASGVFVNEASSSASHVDPGKADSNGSTSPTSIRSKWKHRRKQINQKRKTDIGFSLPPRDHSTPRRVSIAGDQLSVRSVSNPFTSPRDLAQNGAVPSQSKALSQHRASVASEGGWFQESPFGQQLRPFDSNQPQQQQPQQLYNRQTDGSHRPSDASLYNNHMYCSGMYVKSSYSSSGGSSSGIGFSGSTCATNTPITTTFPYPTFGANFKTGCTAPVGTGSSGLDEAAPRRLPSASAQAATNAYYGAYPVQQFANNPYLFNFNQMMAHQLIAGAPMAPNGCQLPSCASRKYSLPVQLESQSVERLSPTDYLLFDKNLQRVDSVNLSPSPLAHHLVHHLPTGGSGRNLPACSTLAGQKPRQTDARERRLVESRRSSQTITRQSSFWLEDDSANSIFSLATSGIVGLQSEDGSQLDVNNLQLEDKPSDQAEFDGQAKENSDQRRASAQQRHSISSLVQSGDSIESVKQRPLAPSDQQQVAASDDKAEEREQADKQRDRAAERRAGGCQKGNMAHQHRNRLSSSSTGSSTGSSPSPDLSRPSKRIFGLAAKSSTISKRHTFGKLRCHSARRHSRWGGNGSSESASGDASRPETDASQKRAGSTCCEDEHRVPQGENEASELPPVEADEQSSNNPSEGDLACAQEHEPAANLDPISLERQCRDLWKLRAALQDDSCVGDDWTNYHQRLNRRYDSGYKSIENQLSSSLEGNVLAASSSLQVAAAAAATSGQQNSPVPNNKSPDSNHSSGPQNDRPPSGCSSGRALELQNRLSPLVKISPLETDKSPTDTCRTNIIEGKLTDLDLDEAPLESRLREATDRDCQSRSSHSSNESADKKTD